MPSRTYVAQRLGAFAGLLHAPALAGYRLQTLQTVSVRDYYFDTADGELLRQGMCLRVREQEGERKALLRSVRSGDDGRAVEAELAGPHTDVLSPPRGPLHEALEDLVGGSAPGQVEPLAPLLRLRQYRTPRVAHDGTRLVGLLSFDVVVLELPDGPHASNELDVEMADEGREEDLVTMDPFLRSAGLMPVERSKFERGVVRLPRSLTEPIFLLPDEREALESLAESENSLHRRRAHVLLLDARGFRSSTIAQQVGLSTARVRHWKQLFREQRMDVFSTPTAVSQVPHPYRVSEIVAGSSESPYSLQSVAPAPPSPAPPPPAPQAPVSAGDGAPPNDETAPEATLPEEPADLDELLDMFQPGPTSTPLLADLHEDEDADEQEASGESAAPAARVAEEPVSLPAEEGSAEPLAAEETAAADVHAADAALPKPTEAAPSSASLAQETPEADAPERLAGSAERKASGRPSTQRPRLSPDDRLVDASLDVLAYYLGQLGWCAADLDRDRGAYRLYLAVHRVRLALEVFEPVLPAESVRNLHQGLRRLAVGLDRAIDLSRQSEAAPGDAVLSERRQRAMDSVRTLLEGRSFEAWIGHAQRILDRLSTQRRAGVASPDDARGPWDDYVADAGGLPGRSRVRHLLGSAIWSRVEGLMAWEKEEEVPDANDAYHLALACSGIRFVLGLAEASAPAPVRRADALLETAEAGLVEIHRMDDHSPPEARERRMAEVWGELRGENLRRALAETLESL